METPGDKFKPVGRVSRGLMQRGQLDAVLRRWPASPRAERSIRPPPPRCRKTLRRSKSCLTFVRTICYLVGKSFNYVDGRRRGQHMGALSSRQEIEDVLYEALAEAREAAVDA